ncbi:MAG: glycosyltransferase family 39 protein [DPANN group archaeon]|nr:glycosyltransferase family 39 protein [DPANN group archaeon]
MKKITLYIILFFIISSISFLIASIILNPITIQNKCQTGSVNETHSWCTLERFENIQTKLKIYSGLTILVSLLLFIKNKWVEQNLNRLKKEFIEIFTKKQIKKILNKIKNEKKHMFILFIILFIAITFRISHLNDPIRTDEAYSYNRYASQPIYISQSVYNVPNNHLLHTIFVKTTTDIFGNSEMAIRLPAFLFGLISIILSYIFARIIFNKDVGLLTATIMSISEPHIQYSTDGRGYSMIITFCILSLILTHYALKTNKNIYWLTLGFIMSLALYTIPSMLHFFIVISFFILYIIKDKISNNKEILYGFIIYLSSTIITTFVLYSPVIIVSGLESLTKISKGTFIWTFSESILFVEHLSSYIFFGLPLHYSLWIFLYVLGAILIYLKKTDIWKTFFILFPIILVSLNIIQKVQPFERTYIYITTNIYRNLL